MPFRKGKNRIKISYKATKQIRKNKALSHFQYPIDVPTPHATLVGNIIKKESLMKLKRILIVMAVAGSSVTLRAMDEEVLKTAFGKLEAKTKETSEILHALEIAKKRNAENAAQKDTITKLEKEISNLNAKLFFWRTPAIVAGVAAAAYGSWIAYEWWTGNDNSTAVSEVASNETTADDASSTNADSDQQDQNNPPSPDESSQNAAPATQTNSDVAPTISHDVLIVPNSTPPGSQAQS
jgi:hypothetical protein